MVEAGGVGIFRSLKTRNLLILRNAKNAENGKIAPNWNVSGTRDFSIGQTKFSLPPQVSFRAGDDTPGMRRRDRH